jgi:hypothetical protein
MNTFGIFIMFQLKDMVSGPYLPKMKYHWMNGKSERFSASLQESPVNLWFIQSFYRQV